MSNTKKYKAGTSFEEIVSLYKFDVELRELFFKYLLQIERQMRSLQRFKTRCIIHHVVNVSK
ncbi:Abi family protein [Anaerobutyricum hallii]|uniref:Abi family protein n=1 Tax=Anaerobutyricum hallii TaxID=39488 RepID=UPI002FE607F7